MDQSASMTARQRTRTAPPPVVIAEDGTPTWNDKWGPGHNDRRRELYASDPEYRAAWLARSRENYRNRQGVELFSCLERLPTLKSFCLPRTVTEGEHHYTDRYCFTMGELAEVIGDHKAPVIYRWQSRGLLPTPICKAQVWIETTGRSGCYFQTQDVYTLEEAEAIVRVIGEHQKVLRYYRAKDQATINKVFEAVQVARDNMP